MIFDPAQKKTQALVLAAHAREPFLSRSVDITSADNWKVNIACVPTVELRGEIELIVMLKDGRTITMPAFNGIEISGARVTASFLKEIQGVRTVTIILEAID